MHNESPYKSRGGPRRLINALRYSVQGLAAAFRHEAAFRQELLVILILMPFAFFVGQDAMQRTLLIGSMFLVLIVELLNSALEAVADTITTGYHPMIGRAKDLGSAAVMLSILASAALWIVLIVNNFAL